MNLIIIGIGGIGSHLLMPLLQYLNEKETIFEDIVLMDGDKYEEKNTKRQVVTSIGQNKASSTVGYYQQKFKNINLLADPRYLNEDNISEIIENKDVILLCVDNNNTRKLVEDYCDKLKEFTLISGGNELYDGNVQVVAKRLGEYVTPKLTEVHPEIAEEDKHPEEMSCEELQEVSSQISIVNATIADTMRRTLFALREDGIKYNEVFINCKNGNVRCERIEQILKV